MWVNPAGDDLSPLSLRDGEKREGRARERGRKLRGRSVEAAEEFEDGRRREKGRKREEESGGRR